MRRPRTRCGAFSIGQRPPRNIYITYIRVYAGATALFQVMLTPRGGCTEADVDQMMEQIKSELAQFADEARVVRASLETQ